MRSAAARVLKPLGGVPLPLRLILVVAAVEMACWISFTPPWQGPDESAHFAYAQHLAEIGDPPVKNFPQIGAGSKSTQHGTIEAWLNLRPTVGLAGARPAWSDVDLDSWEGIEARFGKLEREDGYGPNAVAQNPPVYYRFVGVPYKVVGGEDVLTVNFWMRAWTALLFLFSITFTWLAVGELFGRRRLLQTIAAGAVALLPQLAYISSIVNPDAALATIWTAFTWGAIRLVRRGPTPGGIALMVAPAALSIATHGRGLALVVPAAVALAAAFARHRKFDRWTVAAAAAALVAIALVVRWAFDITSQSGGAAYGGEARFVAGGFTVKGFLNYVWQFYFPRLPGMDVKIGPDYGFDQVFIHSFFGAFGSLEVGWPGWVYDVLHAAQLVGLGALAVVLWIRRRAVISNWPVLLVMAAMFFSMLFVLHFVAYRGMLGQPGDPVLVGRYILPLAGLWAIGIAAVASALPRRAAIGLGAAILTAGALLHVSGLGLTLTRFYG
jgi:4-amino-4-deoxy-L-arabinose transferase-like glycosyltransferase